jgi:hypothetical protein
MPQIPGKYAGTGPDSGATTGQTDKFGPSEERTNSDDRHKWEQICNFSACRLNPDGLR